MWNIHEHKRGNLTWEGRADLSAFIRQAGEAGLYVNLRIGPYICGEYYFGGIPVWMRSVDDVQCFRCADPVWEREMGRIVGEVVEEVRPLLASNGGPVIMLQVENEFSGDEVYLRWAVEMANKLTVGSSVPWILCHDHKQCADMNRDPASGKYDFQALCTINGFWMDEYDSNPGQPSPKWSEDQLANNPGQPVIWTEDQGWFDRKRCPLPRPLPRLFLALPTRVMHHAPCVMHHAPCAIHHPTCGMHCPTCVNLLPRCPIKPAAFVISDAYTSRCNRVGRRKACPEILRPALWCGEVHGVRWRLPQPLHVDGRQQLRAAVWRWVPATPLRQAGCGG